MIDLHTHILFNTDDGSKSIEDSISLIKEEIDNGFKKIVLTPHYMENTKYNNSYKDNLKKFNELKEQVKDLDIELYLANEILVTENIIDLINNNTIKEINNSKYILIELPLNGSIRYLTTVLFNLNTKGYIPIIAHPERYVSLQNKKENIKILLDYDVILQGNLGSIIGTYGNKSKKLFKWLLKKDLYQVLSTDIHRSNKINIKKALKKTSRYIGKNKLDLLTNINPNKIINNLDIETNNNKYFAK